MTFSSLSLLTLLIIAGAARHVPDRSSIGIPAPVADTLRGGGDLLPLVIGNTWSYSSTAMGVHTDSVTYSVTERQTLPDGREIYLFNREWLFDRDAAYIRDGALYGLKAGRGAKSTEMLIPANPRPGRTWRADYGARFTFVRNGEAVTVRAGRFICARIDVERSHKPRPLRLTTWWAPGVGLVKVAGDNIDMELIAYTVH